MGTSLAMIQGLAALGFDTLCATPHQKLGQYMPSASAIGDAYDELLGQAKRAGVQATFVRAAENMWDSVFYERLSSDEIPGYGESAAFLVEFPVHHLPTGLLEHLFRIRLSGRLPVIAHPERYQPLWKAPDLVAELAERCAMVVDLGAVAGFHGRKQGKVARSLLQKGLAHAVASDAHGVSDVRMAERGIAWIRKKLGEDALIRLLDTAPRRILAGIHPAG